MIETNLWKHYPRQSKSNPYQQTIILKMKLSFLKLKEDIVKKDVVTLEDNPNWKILALDEMVGEDGLM